MSSDKPATQRDVIVIAEDSPPNRKILAHLLSKLGFAVIACEHGAEAWEKINAYVNNKAGNKVAAVISDIMMPNMDGLILLDVIRNDDRFKQLPVLLITAMSDKDYIVKAKELNVNGYILKPVTYERVTSKLQEIFPNKTFPKLTA